MINRLGEQDGVWMFWSVVYKVWLLTHCCEEYGSATVSPRTRGNKGWAGFTKSPERVQSDIHCMSIILYCLFFQTPSNLNIRSVCSALPVGEALNKYYYMAPPLSRRTPHGGAVRPQEYVGLRKKCQVKFSEG